MWLTPELSCFGLTASQLSTKNINPSSEVVLHLWKVALFSVSLEQQAFISDKSTEKKTAKGPMAKDLQQQKWKQTDLVFQEESL